MSTAMLNIQKKNITIHAFLVLLASYCSFVPPFHVSDVEMGCTISYMLTDVITVSAYFVLIPSPNGSYPRVWIGGETNKGHGKTHQL